MSETDQDQTQEPTPAETPAETPTPGEPTEEEQEAEEEATIPEAQPEQPPQDSKAAADKATKRILTAKASYARKLREILEDEFDHFLLCPRCNGEELPFQGTPGFIADPVIVPVSAERKTDVLLSVGEEAPNVSEADSYSRRCDSCKGWGRVLSGSKLNAEKTLRCIPCQGRGWVAVGDERRVTQQAVAEPVTANGPQPVVEQPPNADPWGRTPGDPDYGRLPQYVGQA